MGGDRTKMALGSSTWMGPSDRLHLLLLESKGPEEPEESQKNLSSPGIAEVAVVFFWYFNKAIFQATHGG